MDAAISGQNEPVMTVAVIALPSVGYPSREAVEAEIERLIDLLDSYDAVSIDLEPSEDDEDSDDGETQAWPEWHALSGAMRGRTIRRGRTRAK